MAQDSNGMFVTFEANNSDFRNRKRAAKACLSCQKRKKRCTHTFKDQDPTEKETAEKVLPQLVHKEPIKFVGDTNPESVLTELTTRGSDEPKINRIGVWVEESKLESEAFRREQEAAAKAGQTLHITAENGAKKQAAVQKYATLPKGRRTLTGHQKYYLQSVGALRVLPRQTQDVLVKAYVEHIDPLLPIVDIQRLREDLEHNAEVSFWLLQAIALVACKVEATHPYLKLSEEGQVMDPIPFARALHTGLDAAVKADLEGDRFVKVQILTLMSLHNDGPGGVEESSLHLVMAIHDAQTTGLHINTPGRTRNDQKAMLWWTLWCLDKFNACLGGRPLVIADRDIDIAKPVLENTSRSQTMGVWLELGGLLDKIIAYYRPIAPASAGWEGHFPSFDELTKDCNLTIIPETCQNFLELCYNVIGILACRLGGPQTVSYHRRITCANSIQRLTADDKHRQLPTLPLLPYAISLSLTVAYRGLRDGSYEASKAEADLAARCALLETLNKTWWTADAMGKLGRKALKNIQQPASSPTQSKSAAATTATSREMEAHRSVCRYGPFHPELPQSNPDNTKRYSSTLSGNHFKERSELAGLARQTSSGSGLHVLSDAAATARNTMDLSTITEQSGILKSAQAPTNPHKRQKSTHYMANTHSFAIPTSASTTRDRLSVLKSTGMASPLPYATAPTSSLNLVPTTNHGHTFGISAPMDPFCAALTTPVSMATPSQQLSRTTTPQVVSQSLTPQNDQQLDELMTDYYAFNDLDNLFQGFFDLREPTHFTDAIYEGGLYDDWSQFQYISNDASPTAAGGPGNLADMYGWDNHAIVGRPTNTVMSITK